MECPTLDAYYSTLAKIIQSLDFDHVFGIDELSVTEAPPGIYAPAVYYDAEEDVVIAGEGWDCMTGLTGQYGYHGAVMHPFEFVGPGIAEAMEELNKDQGPLLFALVVVEVLDEDEPAGWAIAYREVGD